MSDRIVANACEMRTTATSLNGAGKELDHLARSISTRGLPEMPPGVAGQVEAAMASARSLLTDAAPTFTDGAVELQRRALWAEITDKLARGEALEGSQLTSFIAWMKDGTLMRYATPRQSSLAGRYIGSIYRSSFKNDPKKLIELAQILRASQVNAHSPAALSSFSAGFVESFGADNLNDVPRVIQAMEYGRMWSGGAPMLPFIMSGQAGRWANDELTQDPVRDLLAPFSIALANATYSGKLTRQTEDDIAHNPDTWATAALLSQGDRFGTHFLVECFNTGVVDRVVEHSRLEHLGGAGQDPQDIYRLGGYWHGGEHGLPVDSKQIILDALARNPEAAAQALSQPVDARPVDRYGEEHHVTSPVQLLYGYGDFDDDGRSLGHAFQSGEGYLHNTDREAAGRLTLSVIDQVTNHNRDSLGEVTDSLGNVVRDHYVGDLHQSSVTDLAANYDGDHDHVPGRALPGGIALSRAQVTSLLEHLLDRDDARHALMNGVAAHQTNLVHHGLDGAAMQQIGSFDGLLNSANERADLQDHAEAVKRQQDIAHALDSVTSLVPLPRGVDLIAGEIPDLVAQHWGPHGPPPADKSLPFHDMLLSRIDTTIAAAYVDAHPGSVEQINHELASTHPTNYLVRSFLDADGHVLPQSAMNDDQRQTFAHWLSQHPDITDLTQQAHTYFHDTDQDQSSPP